MSAAPRAGQTLSVQAVHHALHELDLVLQREVDKVRVNDNSVRRPERRVVLEEHGRCWHLVVTLRLGLLGLLRVFCRLLV